MGVGKNGNLIPPVKGEVRNPKGYPKGIPNAKTRYQRILNLIEKVKNPVTGEIEEFTVAEIMDMKMMQKARSGDLGAYREIMDRLEGKAQQKVDVGLEGQLNVALVEFIKPPEVVADGTDENKSKDTS